jgi:inosine-uridine nucleoside N-ribohydrolase
MKKRLSCFFILAAVAAACVTTQEKPVEKIRVIFDTDTNNELDDQHALAYLLFSGASFNLAGVTVNATKSGGDIDKQYAEAERVMRLCGYHSALPLYKGANSNFDSIRQKLQTTNFDGAEAVNFIISEAKKSGDHPLVVIAVGKLTNVALALQKTPAIADNIRVVWLGSNYPEPGEYNQDNDTASMNYVLKTKVPFEMVTVRYGKSTGSAAVDVTQEEVNKRMPGLGPEVIIPVTGRHGGEFKTFGDYSVNLFEHIDYHENRSRALFDMVAVAVVKNPSWSQEKVIPAPVYFNNQWHEQPQNARTIVVRENFSKEKILEDFYRVMENYQLAE